jgi:hypothetical protein
MKLPHSERATISRRKLVDYLLSLTHPGGRSKARFFRRWGFTEENWALLAELLLAIARSGEVCKTISSPYGIKYIVEEELQLPQGGRRKVRTVWIVETGGDTPCFVTAYPV